MKKNYTKSSRVVAALLLGIVMTSVSIGTNAQSSLSAAAAKKANSNLLSEKAPGAGISNNAQKSSALFDVQFNLDLIGAGYAAVAYTGTEVWVSKWATDSLYRLTPAGVVIEGFTIAGVTGVRALTYDGTYIYAGVNTPNIRRIDPATKALDSTIIVNGINVRHITYDPTAHGGDGGFWVGNFDTELRQIDKKGFLVSNIPAATHGLAGMYGSAFDNFSTGGPYLWLFDQGGSGAQLVRVPVATGTPDLFFDVLPSVTGTTGDIAGGLFIAAGIVPGTNTIMGIVQSDPGKLFGLKLEDYVPPAEEASLDAVISTEYLTIPEYHFTPLDFTGTITNNGTSTINGVNFNVSIINTSSTNVYTNSVSSANLASGATIDLTTSTPFTAPGKDSYMVTADVSIDAPQVDEDGSNDTLISIFTVSDSTFAREDGLPEGSIGIGDGTGGPLGMKFTMAKADQITSVSFLLVAPTAGDVVSADVYAFTTAPGNTKLASSTSYTITPADEGSGIFLTLPLTTPLAVTAGTSYLVAVNETAHNLTIANTVANFQENTVWIKFADGSVPWTPVEAFGAAFAKNFILRTNVASMPVGISKTLNANSVAVYPNPASENVKVALNLNNAENITVKVSNLLGQVVYSTVANQMKAGIIDLPINNESAGVYFVTVSSGNESYTQKVTLVK